MLCRLCPGALALVGECLAGLVRGWQPVFFLVCMKPGINYVQAGRQLRRAPSAPRAQAHPHHQIHPPPRLSAAQHVLAAGCRRQSGCGSASSA